MTRLSNRTTIYIDPKVKKGVQLFALRNNTTLSSIVNEKLVEYLEDMADIEAARKIRDNDEPYVAFETVLNDLGINIDDVQSTAKKISTKATKANR